MNLLSLCCPTIHLSCGLFISITFLSLIRIKAWSIITFGTAFLTNRFPKTPLSIYIFFNCSSVTFKGLYGSCSKQASVTKLLILIGKSYVFVLFFYTRAGLDSDNVDYNDSDYVSDCEKESSSEPDEDTTLSPVPKKAPAHSTMSSLIVGRSSYSLQNPRRKKHLRHSWRQELQHI